MGRWEKEVSHVQWDGVDKTINSTVDWREYLIADGHVPDIQLNVSHAVPILDDYIVHDRGEATDIADALPCFVDNEELEELLDVDEVEELEELIDFSDGDFI